MLAPLLGLLSLPIDLTLPSSADARIPDSAPTNGMRFEPNEGQTNSAVDYLGTGATYTLFLTPTEAVMSLRESTGLSVSAASARGHQPSKCSATSTAAPLSPSRDCVVRGDVVRMHFVGANPVPTLRAESRLASTSSYLLGSDPSRWQRDVANFAAVRYVNLWQGVDAVFHGADGSPEYDFVVAPQADPKVIRVAFAGPSGVTVDGAGDLVQTIAGGDRLIQRTPLIYQDQPSGRRTVGGGFQLLDHGEVGFSIPAYDHTRPLVIDPVIEYGTYVGGVSNAAHGLAVSIGGEAYVVGDGDVRSFPTSAGAFQRSQYLGESVLITKYNAQGAIVYATTFGGFHVSVTAPGNPAVDSSGDLYVAGSVLAHCPSTDPSNTCADLPVTSGAFQPKMASGNGHGQDDFIAELDPAGSALVYSSYLGGSGDEGENDGPSVAVDSSDNAYVVGATSSTDFPVTNGAVQPTLRGQGSNAFMTKVASGGKSLVYSTYLGGGSDQATRVAVGSDGSAYVTGYTGSPNYPTTATSFQPSCGGAPPCTSGGFSVFDAFVTRINPAGSSLVYSSYLGGSGNEFGYGIAVDASGAAYLAGYTDSTDFPVTVGAFQPHLNGLVDAYVSKVSTDGTKLGYSTYLGGHPGTCDTVQEQNAVGVAVNTAGNAFVTGLACNTPDFPTTNDAFQPTAPGGKDSFITEMNPSGSGLVYSSYLGGSRDDQGAGIALDGAGNAYTVGDTNSCDFPVTSGAAETTKPGALGGSSSDFGDFVGYLVKVVPGAPSAPARGTCPTLPPPVDAGRLDTTFGTAGMVTTSASGASSAKALLLQSDGMLVAVGGSAVQTASAQHEFALARYTSNGRLDTTFGTGGVVLTDFPNGLSSIRDNASANAAVLQPDGKIVVGGTATVTVTGAGGSTSQQQDLAVARYNTNGTLDTTFGAGGRVVTAGASGVASIAGMALQTDGKIVVADGSEQAFSLARFTAGGALDTTFGSGGFVSTSFNAGALATNDNSVTVALQLDGKILAAGSATYSAASQSYASRMAVARYTSSGALDSTFGSGGEVETSFDTTEGVHVHTVSPVATSLLVQADGRIVLGGAVADDPSYRFGLARYNANGTPDTAFGSGGIVESNFFDTQQVGLALVLQPDGKLVLAGGSDCVYQTCNYAVTSSFLLVRYLSSGTLDTGFGDSGIVETHLSTGVDYAAGLVLQADGNLVAAGTVNFGPGSTFGLARYIGGGTTTGLAATGGQVSATEGAAVNATVATLSDGDGNSASSAYTATIAWGDGSSSAGTVSGSGPFTISGTHAYPGEGSYTVTVTVKDSDGATATATGPATVADAALSAKGMTRKLKTRSLSGVLASFVDADPRGAAGDYTATIAWGDGSTGTGSVSFSSTLNAFTVSGNHTYSVRRTYSITVTIQDTGGSTATATTTAS